jgi:hypothetical protein
MRRERGLRLLSFALSGALFAISGVAGCGGGGAPTAPEVTTTGLVLTVSYHEDSVDRVRVNGATMTTARQFGPYEVTSAQLASGQTLGLVFDAADAGGVMVCGQGDGQSEGHTWEGGEGSTHISGCGMYTIVAGQVVQGALALERN